MTLFLIIPLLAAFYILSQTDEEDYWWTGLLMFFGTCLVLGLIL